MFAHPLKLLQRAVAVQLMDVDPAIQTGALKCLKARPQDIDAGAVAGPGRGCCRLRVAGCLEASPALLRLPMASAALVGF